MRVDTALRPFATTSTFSADCAFVIDGTAHVLRHAPSTSPRNRYRVVLVCVLFRTFISQVDLCLARRAQDGRAVDFCPASVRKKSKESYRAVPFLSHLYDFIV